ncbi:MAG TPA: four helix bundle protein [Candidatus Hydrogenedentes bacterium]|nr:four helix bundle protein [Candidatus Hydrogenedentota bacterium]HRK34361.1 four helix bundle protein [Candidatus Hydrogenedentota bacterium]
MSEVPNPEIRERTFLYSLRAVRLFEHICQSGKSASKVILAEQFLRCATSLGAMVDEAQHTESRVEYADKIGDAQHDAREALYWLRLMKESDTVPAKRIIPIEHETREIISILQKTVGGVRIRTVRRPAK